ncbi:MAG: helix-turn-helix domain-containing protein [Firmicutes bacterium]|nr:helix-turn-helix domain-containing protein [Bacillota bacterium]
MKFGDKVKTLRIQRKMTQEDLAKAVGVSTRTIINYEQYDRYPRNRGIYSKLAETLETSVDTLLTENEEFLSEAYEKYGRRGEIQAQSILDQASALFAGGDLSEDDELAFVHEIQQLYLDSKQRAKKFTPRKYLRTEDTAGE